MATLDLFLLACFIPGIIRGFSKGFLEQALALVGMILSVWAAFHFSTLASRWLQPYLTVSETALSVISFALLLVGVALGAVLLGKALTKLIELALMGWLDKTLGLVFALTLNALVVGIFIILFDTLNTKFAFVKPELLDGSPVYTGLRDFTFLVFPYLKELFFKA